MENFCIKKIKKHKEPANGCVTLITKKSYRKPITTPKALSLNR